MINHLLIFQELLILILLPSCLQIKSSEKLVKVGFTSLDSVYSCAIDFVVYVLILLLLFFSPPFPFIFFLPTGTFGQVLDCLDRETGETVAIKVVRSIKKYREAAMTEIDVLELLKRYDRSGSQ